MHECNQLLLDGSIRGFVKGGWQQIQGETVDVFSGFSLNAKA